MKEIVEAARRKRCRFQLVEAKGPPAQDFHDALKTHPDAWNVLLLDSDAPVEGSLADLCRTKRIDPEHEASVFWMVQVMEAWFLADLSALRAFYGDRLQVGWNPKVEEIPKDDALATLKRLGREYHKTKHAPKLLASIDPALVRKAAPNCDRMFRAILAQL